MKKALLKDPSKKDKGGISFIALSSPLYSVGILAPYKW